MSPCWLVRVADNCAGEIPTALGNLPKLITLSLQDNHLAGTFHVFLSTVEMYVYLFDAAGETGQVSRSLGYISLCKDALIVHGNRAYAWWTRSPTALAVGAVAAKYVYLEQEVDYRPWLLSLTLEFL